MYAIRSYYGEVERGGAGAALAGGLLRQFLEDGQVEVDLVEFAVGEAGADQRFAEADALGDADATVVEEGATALGGGEQFIAVGVEDDRVFQHIAARQRDRDGVLRQAVDKVGGASYNFV